jgi:hypothetical protein
VNYSYLQLLWTHPVGIKMIVLAWLNLLVGTGIYLLLCWALNRAIPPGEENGRKRQRWFLFLIQAAFLIIFIAPVIFVILVGPAAISIMDALQPRP